jgi:predicted ATPase
MATKSITTSKPGKIADEPTARRSKTLPAYFLSLSVENVRCFGPMQELDLSNEIGGPARWTIILGDNGTGKTTLLQCLVALQPIRVFSHKPELIAPRASSGMAFDKLELSNNRENHTFSYQYFKRQVDSAMRLLSTLTAGGSFSKSPNRSSVFSLEYAMRTSNGLNRRIFRKKIYRKIRVRSFMCAYGAGRQLGTSTLVKGEADDSTISLLSDSANLRNAEEWLLRADYATRRASRTRIREKAKEQLYLIENILIKLLPDVDKIRFAEPIQSTDSPSVEFHTPYGWVQLEKLSLGYKTLIAWTVDLAGRFFEQYPKTKNPLAQPAVVLVDEIDLHLHPKWQRKLIQYLSDIFPKTQFIVTAHSPLIVQAAQDANLVVLRREGDHVVIDQSMKAVKGWRVDQIYSSSLFDLPSTRPPEMDGPLAERKKLLTKPSLTKADKAKLKTIEAKLGELPTGANLEDSEAMQFIRRAAKNMKSSRE